MKDESPLSVLGVSLEEQQAYEFLLAHPGSTAPDVAREARWSARRAAHILKALETKGMANCFPERTPRYLPTPPEMALDLLTTRKQEELQRARVIAQRWQSKARQARIDERPVEIITGREAISHMFQHMHRTAHREILCLERAPYVNSPTFGYSNVQQQAMGRGVVLRNIIDPSILDVPGKAESLRREVEEGENTRVLVNLPMKMVIADHRTALIPLTLEQVSDIALLLRPSLLLDALCELFEILWERATPFGTASVAVQISDKVRRSIDMDRLVSLLAAGMNDKSISQELDISARTLERRLLELTRQLGARTRFQAGWQAALRTVSAGALHEKP